MLYILMEDASIASGIKYIHKYFGHVNPSSSYVFFSMGFYHEALEMYKVKPNRNYIFVYSFNKLEFLSAPFFKYRISKNAQLIEWIFILINNAVKCSSAAIDISITKREVQVIHMMSKGNSIQDIAVRMGLSIKSVYNFRLSLYGKLHCNTSIDFIRLSAERNFYLWLSNITSNKVRSVRCV